MSCRPRRAFAAHAHTESLTVLVSVLWELLQACNSIRLLVTRPIRFIGLSPSRIVHIN